MGVFRDYTGKQFHRWKVLRRAENRQDGAACWRCRCECGIEKVVTGRDLYKGRTKSCGCLRDERTAAFYAANPRRKKLKLSPSPSRWRQFRAISVSRPAGRQRKNAYRDADIAALFSGGKTFEAIAKQKNISRSTVAGAIRRARLRSGLQWEAP